MPAMGTNVRTTGWTGRNIVAGRGQAIACGQGEQVAPTMPTINQLARRVHSRGDGLSSPWSWEHNCVPMKEVEHVETLHRSD